MFQNKSAWFSDSVSKACQEFWILEGGLVAGWRTADYLFSADATSPDTMRIFGSKDYLRSKVMVFHSFFLSSCEKRQSVKSVCIGHYVLPPVSVQREVRKVIGRLIWEREDDQSVAQSCVYQTGGTAECSEDKDNKVSNSDAGPSFTQSSEYHSPPCAHVEDSPVSNRLTGYISMDNLPKYKGDVCDFHPMCF